MANRQLSEGEAISLIREMLAAPSPGLEVGVGDDAAVFNFATGRVILTVDSMNEGIHFTFPEYSFADVGWKAMASSVSDVAAMGGQPACALISLAFGDPPGEDDLRALVRGAVEMGDSCNCPIIGGDLCRSTSGVSITVAVAGCQNPAGPVLRSGAREGDMIGVTGTLGDSAGGLHVLQSHRDDLRLKFAGLVESHLRPRPQVRAGEALAVTGAAAMEDVSDGLAADLAHICRESNAGCEVIASSIPLSGELRVLAEESCRDPLDWALGGGEDYELIFTGPPGRFDEMVSALAGVGVQAANIGTITLASSGMLMVAGDGARIDLEGLGYDHFL